MFQTCYSTNGLKNHSLTEAFLLIQKYDFQGIELAITNEHFKDFNFTYQSEELLNIIKKTKANITNIHTGEPFLLSTTQHYPSLITDNKDKRQERINFLKKTILLAEQINCPMVTLVSGLLEEDQDSNIVWKNLIDSLQQLLSCTPNKITLLIEQEPEMFISNTEHLLEIIKQFNGKIKINLDIGHLEVIKEEISESIKKLNGHIANIHFEDIRNNIHQHLLPGEGQINFLPFFKTLNEINFNGNLTADLYPFSTSAEKALITTQKFLQKHLNT